MDTRALVRQFILTECLPGESPANLKDDARLREAGILDSMHQLKLVSLLENELGIVVEAHDVTETNFGSIDEIVAFADGRKSGS